MDRNDEPEIEISTDRGLWADIGPPLVYVTPLPTFFHRQDCEVCEEPLSPVDRQAAIERRLTPCPVCEP